MRRICAVGDLHAADAMYHQDCYKAFFLTSQKTSRKRGRPEDDEAAEAMNEIFNYIEKNDDCQFSMDEFSGPKPTTKTIIEKLKDRFKDRIVLSRVSRKKTVICLRATGEKILNDMWYSARSTDPQEERQRIVKTAAKIILEDIETMAYDNSVYPPTDEFCTHAEKK